MNLSALFAIDAATDVANEHQYDRFSNIVRLYSGQLDIELRAEFGSQ